MRVGVLADVHGNLPALEAVLAAIGPVDRFVCAGDVVGYGPSPNECVEVLRSLDAATVSGNHDLAAVGRLPLVRFSPLALEAIVWTQGALSDSSREWIARLPATLRVDDVLVAHGSLDDPERYVARRGVARELLGAADARVVVLGHTHRPLTVRSRRRLLVNPGAVGQSRELRLRARAAVVDTATLAVTRIAVPYDVERTRAALAEAGLPVRIPHVPPSLPRAAARAVRARL